MFPSSPSRSGKQNNSQFSNPTPFHLRALVLDYLCHHCYTSTARAFARDSTIKHLDADGDEIFNPAKGLVGGSAELSEEVLRQVELREQIRIHILSGRVDDATAVMNNHFPSVLSITNISTPDSSNESQPTSRGMEYTASTSVDPAHLSLNLRILAFIEACRTIPLEYPPRDTHTQSDVPTPSKHHTTPTSPSQALYDHNDPESFQQQSALLSRAQKLYAVADMLPKPSDRATYLKELANVGGLLAYKVPEESSMSKYLSQERREAVADQINSAILYRTGLPAVSYLELYTRYTSTLWSFMHDLRVKPPPVTSRPPGVQLPPSGVATPPFKGSTGLDKDAYESVPPFDLQQFLDSKT